MSNLETVLDVLDYLKEKTGARAVEISRKSESSIEFSFVWFYGNLVCHLAQSLSDEAICESFISNNLTGMLVKGINQKHKEWVESKFPTA